MSNNHKISKQDVEDAYRWIKEQDHYVTRREFIEKYGHQRGQILEWILRVKLCWIIDGIESETVYIPIRVDNEKLERLVKEGSVL